MEHQGNFETKAGTVSGTLLSIAGNLGLDEMVKTLVLAGVGAAASFFVSHLLQWVLRRAQQLRGGKQVEQAQQPGKESSTISDGGASTGSATEDR